MSSSPNSLIKQSVNQSMKLNNAIPLIRIHESVCQRVQSNNQSISPKEVEIKLVDQTTNKTIKDWTSCQELGLDRSVGEFSQFLLLLNQSVSQSNNRSNNQTIEFPVSLNANLLKEELKKRRIENEANDQSNNQTNDDSTNRRQSKRQKNDQSNNQSDKQSNHQSNHQSNKQSNNPPIDLEHKASDWAVLTEAITESIEQALNNQSNNQSNNQHVMYRCPCEWLDQSINQTIKQRCEYQSEDFPIVQSHAERHIQSNNPSTNQSNNQYACSTCGFRGDLSKVNLHIKSCHTRLINQSNSPSSVFARSINQSNNQSNNQVVLHICDDQTINQAIDRFHMKYSQSNNQSNNEMTEENGTEDNQSNNQSNNQSSSRGSKWCANEDKILLDGIRQYTVDGKIQWKEFQNKLPGRSAGAMQARYHTLSNDQSINQSESNNQTIDQTINQTTDDTVQGSYPPLPEGAILPPSFTPHYTSKVKQALTNHTKYKGDWGFTCVFKPPKHTHSKRGCYSHHGFGEQEGLDPAAPDGPPLFTYSGEFRSGRREGKGLYDSADYTWYGDNANNQCKGLGVKFMKIDQSNNQSSNPSVSMAGSLTIGSDVGRGIVYVVQSNSQSNNQSNNQSSIQYARYVCAHGFDSEQRPTKRAQIDFNQSITQSIKQSNNQSNPQAYQTYIGQISGGLPHGYGELTLVNGNKFYVHAKFGRIVRMINQSNNKETNVIGMESIMRPSLRE